MNITEHPKEAFIKIDYTNKVKAKYLSRYLSSLSEEYIKEGEFKSVAFYWDYAKFKDTNRYNYKGICEKISKKPFNVIFENDEIKDYMTAESHLDKPWQDLIYVVDIEYTTVKGKGQIKILKVYTDQTYFQSKDE